MICSRLSSPTSPAFNRIEGILLLASLLVLVCSPLAAAFLPSTSVAARVSESTAIHAAISTNNPEVLDVAIVGGGPTGLACALALLRASSSTGRRTSMAVFEADNFQPKGASIVISKPGWKALKAICSQTYAEAKADAACVSGLYFDDFSGRPLLPRPVRGAMKYMVRPVLRLLRTGIVRSNSWHAFRSCLRRGVERAGMELEHKVEDLIRTNTSLVSVDPNYSEDGALLTFEDGTEVVASTVLACDGTFSTVRKCLDHGNDNPVLVDEGKTVWRGTAPNIDTRGESTFYIAQEEAKTKGATANIFPAGRTTGGSSLSIIMPTSLPGRAKGSEDARQRLKEALAALNVPIAGALMDAIDDVEYMLEHKLHVRDFDMFPEFYSGFDCLAYLGDSAHPLRPTGEGVALALEDAWTIGNLAYSDSGKRILTPDLLRKYEGARQARVAAVCKAVRDLAESYYKDEEESSQKKVQTTKPKVNQAMKEYPIYLTAL